MVRLSVSTVRDVIYRYKRLGVQNERKRGRKKKEEDTSLISPPMVESLDRYLSENFAITYTKMQAKLAQEYKLSPDKVPTLSQLRVKLSERLFSVRVGEIPQKTINSIDVMEARAHFVEEFNLLGPNDRVVYLDELQIDTFLRRKRSGRRKLPVMDPTIQDGEENDACRLYVFLAFSEAGIIMIEQSYHNDFAMAFERLTHKLFERQNALEEKVVLFMDPEKISEIKWVSDLVISQGLHQNIEPHTIPPFSPTMNPLEMFSTSLRRHLREQQLKQIKLVPQALNAFLSKLSADDTRSYISRMKKLFPACLERKPLHDVNGVIDVL